MYKSLLKHTKFVFQICDLGSARRLEDTVKQTTIVGTYAWMAPEVLKNLITHNIILVWELS